MAVITTLKLSLANMGDDTLTLEAYSLFWLDPRLFYLFETGTQLLCNTDDWYKKHDMAMRTNQKQKYHVVDISTENSTPLQDLNT